VKAEKRQATKVRMQLLTQNQPHYFNFLIAGFPLHLKAKVLDFFRHSGGFIDSHQPFSMISWRQTKRKFAHCPRRRLDDFVPAVKIKLKLGFFGDSRKLSYFLHTKVASFSEFQSRNSKISSQSSSTKADISTPANRTQNSLCLLNDINRMKQKETSSAVNGRKNVLSSIETFEVQLIAKFIIEGRKHHNVSSQVV
jgi:hypothetical protein